MGEFFRDSGRHALMIYDDLTKHAQAYRQLSLLLRRPPGREAYPGDVFYLHSRLLERAAKMSDEMGGGSLTALPIIETQAGDVSAYIPTNVISITDGQIVLDDGPLQLRSAPRSTSASRCRASASRPRSRRCSRSAARSSSTSRSIARWRPLRSSAPISTQSASGCSHRGARLTEMLKQNQYESAAGRKGSADYFRRQRGLSSTSSRSSRSSRSSADSTPSSTRAMQNCSTRSATKSAICDDLRKKLTPRSTPTNNRSSPGIKAAAPARAAYRAKLAMATLKAIRRRISSVKSTQQITRAMKLVAAARLRRAQEALVNARPISEALQRVADSLLLRRARLASARPRTRARLAAGDLASDRGLCGGYNANLFREAERKRADARRGARHRTFRRRPQSPRHFKRAAAVRSARASTMCRAWRPSRSRAISPPDARRLRAGAIGEAGMVYSHFRSAISQRPVYERLLPIKLPARRHRGRRERRRRPVEAATSNIWSSRAREQLIPVVLRSYLEARCLHALLEAEASEHGARMTAMDSGDQQRRRI